MICIFPNWHSIYFFISSLFLAMFLNLLTANQKLLFWLYIDIRCHLLEILQSEFKIENDDFYTKLSFSTLFFPLNSYFHGNNALYTLEPDFIELLTLFNIGIDILFSYLSQIEAEILELLNLPWIALVSMEMSYFTMFLYS